jgi:hypothetical protein
MPFFGRHIADFFVAALPGVIYKDVEPAELAIHSVEKGAGALDPADIGDGAEDSAEALHFGHSPIDGRLSAATDGDGGAIVEETLGDGTADAAGSSGDDGKLALE